MSHNESQWIQAECRDNTPGTSRNVTQMTRAGVSWKRDIPLVNAIPNDMGDAA